MSAAARRSSDLHVGDFAQRMLALADEASDVRATSRDPKIKLTSITTEANVLDGALAKLGIGSGDQVLALAEARDLARAVVDVIADDPDVGNKLAAALERYNQRELGRQFANLADRTRSSRPKELA